MNAPPARQPAAAHERGWLVLGALVYLAFVIYGSIVPLNFRPMPLSAATDAFLALVRMGIHVESQTDLATNVLLTIPLAFLWSGASWPRSNAAWRIPVAIAVYGACLVVSASVEFLQLFFPGRTAALSDILAQAIGSAIGIAAWWLAGARVARWLISLPQLQSRGGVAQWLLMAYLFVLIGYSVLPLDLTVSPVEIYHKWREGRILIVPFSWPYTDRAQEFYEYASNVAIWIPAAFLWRLSSAKPNASVWVGVVGVATLVEFLQLFVYSRVSNSTDVILSGAGAALGIWSSGVLQRPDRMRRTAIAGSRDGPANGLWPWLAATFTWLAVLAVVFWYPFNFNFDHDFLRERVLGLKQVPLEAYWSGSEIRAVTEVLHKTGFMFPLGLLLGGMAARRRIRVPHEVVHTAAALFIVAVAATIEAVQIALPGKNADLTDWFLEACGGIAGYVVCLAVWSRLWRP